MYNGWTGGQYSLYRVALGVLLAWHAARLPLLEAARADGVEPWRFVPLPRVVENPVGWALLLGLAVALSLAIVTGVAQRSSVVALSALWLLLPHHRGLGTGSILALMMLVAHGFTPRAPYGSWPARGRPDPDGGWRLPEELYLAAWVVLAVGYFGHGLLGLGTLLGTESPPLFGSGLVFAHELPLRVDPASATTVTIGRVAVAIELSLAGWVWFRSVRPWAWLLLVVILPLRYLPNPGSPVAELNLGLVLLHMLTFDPAWVRPRTTDGTDIVFYDGTCGLCHRSVRFLLAEDRSGSALRYAPLNGPALASRLSTEQRSVLPDSLAVLTASGELLTRSGAVLRCAERLGGLWRIMALAGRAVPRPVRDGAYDLIAAARYRLFSRPEDVCPVLSPELRSRFESGATVAGAIPASPRDTG